MNCFETSVLVSCSRTIIASRLVGEFMLHYLQHRRDSCQPPVSAPFIMAEYGMCHDSVCDDNDISHDIARQYHHLVHMCSFFSWNVRYGTIAVPNIMLFFNGRQVNRFNRSERSLETLVDFVSNVTGKYAHNPYSSTNNRYNWLRTTNNNWQSCFHT